MPKDYGAITQRLLQLPLGRSCVVNVQRPDRYIKTARRHAPDIAWSVETVEGGKVITRVR